MLKDSTIYFCTIFLLLLHHLYPSNQEVSLKSVTSISYLSSGFPNDILVASKNYKQNEYTSDISFNIDFMEKVLGNLSNL